MEKVVEYELGFNPNLDAHQTFDNLETALDMVMELIEGDPEAIFCEEGYWEQLILVERIGGGKERFYARDELVMLLRKEGRKIEAPSSFSFESA